VYVFLLPSPSFSPTNPRTFRTGNRIPWPRPHLGGVALLARNWYDYRMLSLLYRLRPSRRHENRRLLLDAERAIGLVARHRVPYRRGLWTK